MVSLILSNEFNEHLKQAKPKEHEHLIIIYKPGQKNIKT